MATVTWKRTPSWRSKQSAAVSLPTPVSANSLSCNQSNAANAVGRLNSFDFRKGLEGLIAWLPQQGNIAPSSRVHQELNSGAFNHPCLVIETSKCGLFVFCLQITSFGNGTIQDKYSRCQDPFEKSRIFNEYVALRNPDTVDHNELGQLDYTGPEMQKQSYVHLEFGFWIEWQHLTRWGGRTLSPKSFSTVSGLYSNAEAERQSRGSQGIQRLAASSRTSRSISPPTYIPCAPTHEASRSWTSSRSACGNNTPYSNKASMFTIPGKGNAAVAIKAPSQQKQQDMQGSWRVSAAA